MVKKTHASDYMPWPVNRTFFCFCAAFEPPGQDNGRPTGHKLFIVYKLKPWTEVALAGGKHSGRKTNGFLCISCKASLNLNFFLSDVYGGICQSQETLRSNTHLLFSLYFLHGLCWNNSFLVFSACSMLQRQSFGFGQNYKHKRRHSLGHHITSNIYTRQIW